MIFDWNWKIMLSYSKSIKKISFEEGSFEKFKIGFLLVLDFGGSNNHIWEIATVTIGIAFCFEALIVNSLSAPKTSLTLASNKIGALDATYCTAAIIDNLFKPLVIVNLRFCSDSLALQLFFQHAKRVNFHPTFYTLISIGTPESCYHIIAHIAEIYTCCFYLGEGMFSGSEILLVKHLPLILLLVHYS